MENTQTKTNGHTWKSPFLALCPGLPSNSTLLCSQLLARVPPILFPSKLPEKLLCSSTIFLLCLPSQATLLPSYSPVSKHGLPNHSPCSCTPFLCTTPSAATFSSLSSAPLDGLRDPLLESSSTCQSLTAASKSEVDSLWPLRM